MSYIDKTLDRKSIIKAVEAFPDYHSHKIENHGNQRYNIKVKIRGQQNEAMLNVIHLTNGNTTLNTSVGRNQQTSNEIAENILNTCSLPDIESKRLYVPKMSDIDFDTLINFLSADSDLTVSPPENSQYGKKYIVGWIDGGNVHVNRFSSGSFSVQGKSNYAKGKIVEILTQVIPYKEVIDLQLKSLEVNVTSDQVLADVEDIMPDSFVKMNPNLLTILSPSFALKTITIDLSDYSALTFPVLRVIEGVLRQTFDRVGIIPGDNVGSIFAKNTSTGEHFLQTAHSNKISDVTITNAINNLYKVFYNQRHQLFHIGDLIDIPRVIETKEEAIRIIDQAAEAIEVIYKTYK